MTEIDIIRGCQKELKAAQEHLFEVYSDRMFRLCFRYVRLQADAEDVVIRGFSKVFESISNFKYQGDGSLEAWIRKIVVNESLMWLRRRHNFNMTETIEDTLPQIDLSSLGELEAKDIYGLIGQLPTGYRTVFNLFVIEGYSHEEIAAMLKISEGTSRSQLFKAKSLLKKALTREGFQYGT
ncbi:DNA-directed RNA polymerase sigma-70 factor [Cytophagales bacterium WSM2-2]|nr:DNA-directed RNA polymerase sigma-70 factor [Cytophagales bacterium WSM2-2]